MKKNILTIALIVLVVLMAHSQTKTVVFGYDNAGNRTSKTIVMKKSLSVPKDSISQEEFKDAVAETKITIYPNPTKGVLKVKFENLPTCESCGIEMYNTMGIQILKVVELVETTELNITDQPSGMYIMQIRINGKSTTWKIVKE